MRPLLALLAVILGPASGNAQDFSQVIIFGDSSVDGGWWQGAYAGQCDGMSTSCTPANDTAKSRIIGRAVAAGHDGAPVGSGEMMNSELLAGRFGLTADPANQPGGTNYAISGATNSEAADGGNVNMNKSLPSTTQQMARYLAVNGGAANSSALYLISSGGNDISFIRDEPGNGTTRRAFLDAQADALIDGVEMLRDAGARYFVVDSVHGAGGAGTLGEFYTQQLWTGLADAGINFIPADISAMVRGVQADPTRFGFTAATVNGGVVIGGTSTGSACVIQSGAAGPTVGWGQWCVNTTTPSSQYAYLASADAQQTYFYSDDQHFSAAGQQIEADYVFSLIVAPSQISMLAESAAQARFGVVNGIQRQIEASQARQGPGLFNVWTTGDIGELQADNATGFPGGSGQPKMLAGGLSYRAALGLILGAAVSIGRSDVDWGDDRGGFTQDEATGSLYAAFKGRSLWADIVGTYGALSYDVNRGGALGIARIANHGETDGDNWSVGGRAGYDFQLGDVVTGPVVGVLWQRVAIDGFTETVTDFTALSFSDQTRDSLMSTLGWRAKIALGDWQPFAEIAWNHEFASDDRTVTAALTSSIYAPAYSMPAVGHREDWASATIGTTVDLGGGLLALGSVRTEFDGEGDATYGGQLGLNVSF
jgi:outer membrane lipase/esterase